MKKARLRRLSRGIAAVAALLPLSVCAAPLLSYGDISIDTRASTRLVSFNESDPPPVTLPAGDSRKAGAYADHWTVGPNWWYGGFEYGTATQHPEVAFSSAQMNGRGFADLGVSGMSEGPTLDSWGYQHANVTAKQRVTNVGGKGLVNLDYTIPLIEIAQRGTRFNGLIALIDAVMFISLYDKNGAYIGELDGFDYLFKLEYEKPPTTFGIFTYTASEDLLRDSTGMVDVDWGSCPAFCTGKAVRPFTVSRSLYELEPGDYLEYEYVLDAYLLTGREGGGHAMYGDPLAFSVGGGRNFFEFSAADAPAGSAPEPASWALLALGMAALARRGGLRS